MSSEPTSGGRWLPAGTRLNDMYEIEVGIAAGGMGEIYRGHNIQTGDEVAIKMIRSDMTETETAMTMFRKEASALNKLFNEAIVRYYGFSVDPTLKRPYMAMEFVGGRSLSDILKEHALPFDDVRVLGSRVAGGLQVAHERGIIHRDISPDNIIIPEGDVSQAKIIDFGIARQTKSSEGTIIGDGFAGKYNYVSPEQLGLCGGEVTGASDIYSLGLVLAEAVTGRAINMRGNPVEVIEKRRKVPDLSHVDPRIAPLIAWMLAPEPRDRPSSMAEVAAWLRRGSVPPSGFQGDLPDSTVAIPASQRWQTGAPSERPRSQPPGWDPSGQSRQPGPSQRPSQAPQGWEQPPPSQRPSQAPQGWEQPPPSQRPSQAPQGWEQPHPSQRPSQAPQGWEQSPPSQRPSQAPQGWEQPPPSQRPSQAPQGWDQPSPSQRPSQAPQGWEQPSPSQRPSQAPQGWEQPHPSQRPSQAPQGWEQPGQSRQPAGWDQAPQNRRPSQPPQGWEPPAQSERPGPPPGWDQPTPSRRPPTPLHPEDEVAGTVVARSSAGQRLATPVAEPPPTANRASLPPAQPVRPQPAPTPAATPAPAKSSALPLVAGLVGLLVVGGGGAAFFLTGGGGGRPDAKVEARPEAKPVDRPADKPVVAAVEPKPAATETVAVEALDEAGLARQRQVRRADLAAFLQSYRGGECFYLAPVMVDEGRVVTEGFGRSIAPFEALDDDFRTKNGFEADIRLRQVTDAQCPALDFLTSHRGEAAARPRIELATQRVKAGDTVVGEASAPSGDYLSILMVRDDGTVRLVTPATRSDRPSVQFTLPAERGGEGGGRPGLVVALSSSMALTSLSTLPSEPAAGFVDRLAKDAARTGAKLAAAAQYVVVDR
jgi:serine/threonine-protein kinase